MATLAGKVDRMGPFVFAANGDWQQRAEEEIREDIPLEPIPLTQADERAIERLDSLSQQVDELARLSGLIAVKIGLLQREMTELVQRAGRVAQEEDAELEATAQKVAEFAIGEGSPDEPEEDGLDSWEVINEDPPPPTSIPLEQEYVEY